MEIKSAPLNVRKLFSQGLLAGFIALNVCVLGMVELFDERELIGGVLTLGQVILYSGPALIAYFNGKKYTSNRVNGILAGLLIGLFSAIPLIILIILAENLDLRDTFAHISPALSEILTFGQGPLLGSLILAATLVITGTLSAGLATLPDRIRRPILAGITATLVAGLFSEILTERLRAWFGPGFIVIIFQSGALRPLVALLIFLVAAGISAWWNARGESIRGRYQAFPQSRQMRIRRSVLVAALLSLLILPLALGPYLSEVTDNIGIFILMGLGLNIVVGFAGLLDLGYVAFFAIGAYTMGLLTSTGELGIGGTSFWVAVPIAIGVSVFAGLILGIPVLRMRGDYLAIVTLGFGEIIRILALSDLLKPYIGGAQGVLNIPNPVIGFPKFMVSPQWFFYIILAGCAIAWFVSSRLSEARLGRQWMAMREDEDVAEAMGIRLVSTKLLAFALGAAFSGLSGAIFGPKLTSIFPHSFQLLISINVLAIIIVGGMGSLPGVVVGSIILVGLPELLREFAEYRLLIYGALLVVMMLVRPEGFWPSAVRRRELHSQVELEARTDVSPHPEHLA
jgi:branched-chain amino acid transport system permease protein